MAARRNKRMVMQAEFEDAKDKVMMGAERKSLVMTDEEKMLTAYHEGGHAIVALNVKATDPVHKATIIPRGRALGMVMQLPERDKLSMSREQMTSRLAIMMGGRVAEEIAVGDISTGAEDDLQRATDLVRHMITRYGMSEALGFTNTTLGLAGMFLSVGAVGAAIPGVLANSQALLVAPFAALFFGEVLSRGRVLGLLVGLSGIAVVLSGDGDGLVTVKGAAFSLMAAGGVAAGNLVMKHIGCRVDGLTATAWQYVLGGLPLLGWALVVEEPAEVAWTRTFVAGLLFLGVVGSAGTSWLWYHLVRDGELIPLNALTLFTPVFALGLALLIYRERLSAPSLGGVAATAAGVMWVSWPRAEAVEAPGRRLGAR